MVPNFSATVLSPVEALAQSPTSSNLGRNVLLVQLHLELVVVSRHPAIIAVMEVLVYIASSVPDCPSIQVRPRINEMSLWHSV